MSEWIKKKALAVGTKENTLGKIDENGELLEFEPSKVNGKWKGYNCKHVTSDFPTIAKMIITDLKPKIVVELGTGNGGVTSFFADTIKPWGGIVHTFDYIQFEGSKGLTTTYDNVIFYEEDCVHNGPNQKVIDVISNDNVLLYCDNGKKELEIEYYSQYITKGSVIGCHDYDTEVDSIWIEDFLKKAGFNQFHHDILENLRGTIKYPLGPGYQDSKGIHITNGGSLSRFWIKA